MDKSKFTVLLLIVVVVALGGLSAKLYLDYTRQRQQFTRLRKQYEAKIAQLTQAKQAVEKERERIQAEISRLKKDIATYRQQIDSLRLEKKKWEDKYNAVLQEKVSLKEKIDRLKEELEAKKEEVGDLKYKLEKLKGEEPKTVTYSYADKGDDFWADVVQKKTELEAKVAELERMIREKELERKEALQKKLELEVKLSELDLKNRELKRQLDYARRMISILSRDFVREKENRRAMKELLDRMEKENEEIKDKIVRLTKSETYLQKQLSRTEEEKELLERHIQDMNTIVKESIEQILDLTERMKNIETSTSEGIAKAKVVNLPPIVVNSTGNASSETTETGVKVEGKILNVNEAHNFVVIDLGKNDGVIEGMEFDVLRDGKKIARVKVRMLKDNVCAADIVKLYGSEGIKVGDKVR